MPPFQFLSEKALNAAIKGISSEFFPKGSVIATNSGQDGDFLYVIKKGGVKRLLDSDGQQIVVDYKGEGDTIGYMSLLGEDVPWSCVKAIDDTICYLLRKDHVQALIDSDGQARNSFSKSFLHPANFDTLKEDRGFSYTCGEKILFSTPVADIARNNPATASQHISIREAARLMTERKTDYIVITDADAAPVGIVTNSDLRDKVVSLGMDVNLPARTIMTEAIHSVDAGDYCYEAVLKMVKNNVHHLVVISGGCLWGVLTNHDLMLLQGTSPLSIVKAIEAQSSVDGLIPVSNKINGIYSVLLAGGARAGNILRIITEINDRLVRKIITLAERDLGSPPVAYAWICFGSEGRKEQTFKTDQDNAIIYNDPANEGEAQAAFDYFSSLSKIVRISLLQVGFPQCPALYMASNPMWRRPLKTWKKYAADWCTTPSAKAVLNTVTFFDSRTVYGDETLLTAFSRHLMSHITGNRLLLGKAASLSIKNAPPIGFLKTFVVEKSGEHKDMLNLKVKGVAPIVDLVRFFALEKGISTPTTSTLMRIEALTASHSIVKEYAEELVHAFEYIMLLRIQHQYEKIRNNLPPDNFIRPDKLSNLQRRTIKEAFQVISKIQNIVIERYREMIW
ncbi:MAG: DUF294 nucleotidyltransferase-like domain-containing protein [Candidatus Magnetominusculus sp. LBB02]|nr:DUF294 nucleotidyltransferase-like domain-containing protein [Candidatus Magnetominusculus sp. LBB02]